MDFQSEDCTDSQNTEPIQLSVTKLISFICTFLLSWQGIFRLPDIAIGVIFKFLSILFLQFGEITGLEDLKLLHKWFPNNLKHARNLQAIDRDDYEKFVVCQRCHSTYPYSDCMEKDGINKCTFVRYPRHKQKRMRTPCNFPLMKTVKTASGKQNKIPIKFFCYRSIIHSIQQLVQQPGILNLFNEWRNRNIPSGIMADVYDGAVWKSFLSINGNEFLLNRYTLGLLINVDWFEPYKHVKYSVGAIYIAILNYELPAGIQTNRTPTYKTQ